MNFEQWMRRPVYVVQCYTARIARSLSIWRDGTESTFYFRALPPYRRDSKQLRRATASKLREMRRLGILDRHAVRREYEISRRNNQGIATRCDLQSILGLPQETP